MTTRKRSTARGATLRPRLTAAESARLKTGAWYLNLAEMQAFCRKHCLPMHICVEGEDGKLRRTSDRDRKDIVIARILAFALRGERNGPTVYARRIVADGRLPKPLTRATRVRYGQYEKHNPAFVAALRDLTGGVFRTGMIARLVLRDFWTAGKAPTLAEFARAWEAATAAHTQPRLEGAYLVDLAKGEGGPRWKAKRVKKAREALRILGRLVRERDSSA